MLSRMNSARALRTALAALTASVTSAFAVDPGFVPLFNGRNLDGWVNANCAPETWTATNGVIHCTGFPIGALRTVRQYENFILEVDWRHLSSGGNSGVFIWGTPIAAPGVPFLRGIEVQVLDHGFDVPGKNEWYTTHGDVFPIHGATMTPFGRHNGQRSFPSQERSLGSPQWNHYRIVCTNGTLRLSVNGAEVSGGADCNYRKGYLALESEGAPVEFKNVVIKELPSSKTPPHLTAPLDEGFRSVFTGLDFRGWTQPANSNVWAVAGERLRCNGAAGGELALWLDSNKARRFEFIADARRGAKDAAASPAALILQDSRGATFTLPFDCPANDKHHRFRFKVDSKSVTTQVDDAQPSTRALPASWSRTIHAGLQSGSGTTEFMNLYWRKL